MSSNVARLSALSLSFGLVVGVPAVLLIAGATGPEPAQPVHVIDPFSPPPRLGAEPPPPPPPSPLEKVRARGQATESVRTDLYGVLGPHPLIEEAAEILTREMRRYARDGVFITSVARTPEDQLRLMGTRRYSYWTTPRSKHLLGMAVDIAFVGRRASTWRLRDVAEAILAARLGARAELLRVVRESRCLHIEIDTLRGRHLIDERRALLENLGIVQGHEGPHPVPELAAYVPESDWLERPRDLLAATF